jgi:hypothetical protein
MTDQTPDTLPDPDEDERSDLEQAVEARAEAVARGEGGSQPPEGVGGESGASGVVKNQEGMDQ